MRGRGGVKKKKKRRIKRRLPEGKCAIVHVALARDPSRCPQKLLRPHVCGGGGGSISETHIRTQRAASAFNRCPVRTRRQLHSRPSLPKSGELTGRARTGISSQVNPCVMQSGLCRAAQEQYGAGLKKYTREGRERRKRQKKNRFLSCSGNASRASKQDFYFSPLFFPPALERLL